MMSERFPFTTDRPLVPSLIINENVEWNTDENMDLGDTINDSYVTAVGDNTQYLSVLDNTLEGLNILSNPKLEPSDEFTEVENEEQSDQQVVLFTVEGSDEYYGIQLAQDEDGNIRKYQFQFKQLENGQFEAIPESIQLLHDEEEDVPPLSVAPTIETKNGGSGSNLKIFVAENNENEHILPDNFPEEENYQPEEEEITVMYDEPEHELEILDDKTGVLQSIKNEKTFNIDEVKREHVSSYYSDEADEEPLQYEEELTEIPRFYTRQEELENAPIFENQTENFESNEQQEPEEPEPETESSEAVTEEMPESILPHLNDEIEVDYGIASIPVSGDFEQEKFCHTTILKDTLKAYKEQVKPKKDQNKLLYFIVQHPEKENVHSISFDNKILQKSARNPRSILKTSHSLVDISKQQPIEYVPDERMSKRFSRGKEAVQARLFNNFINKTTILQAPIRQQRLPRKQKIKPVERLDEEIIVKEVIVSSEGFVEPDQNLKNIDNLAITSYVELSDSDDDYDTRKDGQKGKRKQSSDEEESESSIINLDSDEEEDNNNKKIDEEDAITPTKRRRGRPPKSRSSEKSDRSDKSVKQLESPLKKIRVDSSEDEKKAEIQCPKCPKTFPSQNSLKTHLQHHNLENTIRLRSRATTTTTTIATTAPATKPKIEYKHKCDKCQSTFKNNILLSRHKCSSPEISCPICKKKFPNKSTLNVHKRMHMKGQLLKSTEDKMTVKISPKKFKSPAGVKTLAPKLKPTLLTRKLRSSTLMNRSPGKGSSPVKSKLRPKNSPNKSGVFKTPNYKRRAPHGGVPVPARLRKAFDGLRKKLEELETTGTDDDDDGTKENKKC